MRHPWGYRPTHAAIDTSFTTTLRGGFNDTVSAITLQADGRVLAGGEFTQVGPKVARSLARIT